MFYHDRCDSAFWIRFFFWWFQRSVVEKTGIVILHIVWCGAWGECPRCIYRIRSLGGTLKVWEWRGKQACGWPTRWAASAHSSEQGQECVLVYSLYCYMCMYKKGSKPEDRVKQPRCSGIPYTEGELSWQPGCCGFSDRGGLWAALHTKWCRCTYRWSIWLCIPSQKCFHFSFECLRLIWRVTWTVGDFHSVQHC